jgi:hypothetical protein
MVEDSCGGVIDVTVENGGSLITEGDIIEKSNSSRHVYSLLKAVFVLFGTWILL